MHYAATDPPALRRLLRRQEGLLSLAQAESVGVTSATLSRASQRVGSGWQRVLPRVYARFDHALTERDQVRAAVLYAGDGARLTGGACLRWRHVAHLPDEIPSLPVDVLVPHHRQVKSTDEVRIRRSRTDVRSILVDHLATVPLARATLDAALTQRSDDVVLGLVNAVVNGGHATTEELREQLLVAPLRGSGSFRRTLLEIAEGTRSVPEAVARRLFCEGGLPEPAINSALRIGATTYLPDFRWGRLIVEIDSREHHLLGPGAYEATLARRAALQAAGYVVVPITPSMLRDDPAAVLATVWQAYRLVCG